MDEIYETGRALPEFQAMFEVVFPSNGFGGYPLKHWHDRERTAHEIQPEAFGALSQIPELQALGAAALAAGCRQLRCRAGHQGDRHAEDVAGYAGQLVGAAFESGKFMFADTDLKVDLPQVRVTIDRERVADLGLDPLRSAGSWDPARRRLRQSLHDGRPCLQGDPAGRTRCARDRCPASRLQDPDPRRGAGAVRRGRPARDLGRAAHLGAFSAG